jgi:hypothetical protein
LVDNFVTIVLNFDPYGHFIFGRRFGRGYNAKFLVEFPWDMVISPKMQPIQAFVVANMVYPKLMVSLLNWILVAKS